jgi:hypothetical protein
LISTGIESRQTEPKEKQEKAAKRIQRGQPKNTAKRKKLRDREAAAIKIQSTQRGRKARKRVKAMRENNKRVDNNKRVGSLLQTYDVPTAAAMEEVGVYADVEPKKLSAPSTLSAPMAEEEVVVDAEAQEVAQEDYDYDYGGDNGDDGTASITSRGFMEAVEDVDFDVDDIEVEDSCPTCGNVFERHAAFCSQCGYRRPEPELCGCGRLFLGSQNECPKCGTARGASDPQKVDAAIKIQKLYRGIVTRMKVNEQKAELARLAKIKRCVCGNQFADRDLVCIDCGQERAELGVCTCEHVLAPDVATCRNCGRRRLAEVCLSFGVRNVDHPRLVSKKSTLNSTILQIKACIAKKAGSSIMPSHVDVKLEAGAMVLQVQATVKAPNMHSANAVKSQLAASKNSWKEDVVTSLQSINEFESITTGAVSVGKISVTKSEVMIETSSNFKYKDQQDEMMARRQNLLNKRKVLQRTVKKVAQVARFAKVVNTLSVLAKTEGRSRAQTENEPDATEVDSLRAMARSALGNSFQLGFLRKILLDVPRDEINLYGQRMSQFGQLEKRVNDMGQFGQVEKRLNKTLRNSKVLPRSSTKSHADLVEELRKKARDEFTQAWQNGTLPEISGNKVVPELDAVEAVKERARTSLIKAVEDGSWDRAVQNASFGQAEGSNASTDLEGTLRDSGIYTDAEGPESTENLRSRAKTGLGKSYQEGTPQSSLNKQRQAAKPDDLRRRAKSGLIKSNREGTLQSSLKKSGQEAQPDNLRYRAKTGMWKSYQEGTLQSSLKKHWPEVQGVEKGAAPAERRGPSVKDRARTGLAKSHRDGTLKEAVTSTQREAQEEQRIRNEEELRQRIYSSLVQATEDGSLNDQIREVQRSVPAAKDPQQKLSGSKDSTSPPAVPAPKARASRASSSASNSRSSVNRKLSHRVLTPPIYQAQVTADAAEPDKSNLKADAPRSPSDSKPDTVTASKAQDPKPAGAPKANARRSGLRASPAKAGNKATDLATRMEQAKASGGQPKKVARQPKAAGRPTDAHRR